jgi:TolB protein
LSRARRGGAAWAAITAIAGAAGAVAAALLGAPAAAEQRPAVVVTPGKSQIFKAAVQRFADSSGFSSGERTREFRKALSEALEYSSVFEVVDPKAFLGPDQTRDFGSSGGFTCVDWKTIGADALVQGEIQVDASRYSAEFRLWDTARCKRLIRKRYRQDAELDPNLVAKRIADDIVAAFIGVRGVASTELAFVSDRSGTKEIYVMNANGRRQRAVTANRSINNFPAWSPDGDSIVFTSYRHRNRPTLFVTTRGQGKPRRLLTGFEPDRSQYRGVFDPIGRSLAVVMSDGGPSEIYTVRPSARKIRRITKNSVIDISPSWSPNGKQMVYVSDRSGSPQIYLMDADGEGSRRLTYNGSYNTAPAWSPDGKWIAYETRVGGQFDIWLIDPEGTVNVPLITHPRSDEAPAWSPNSRKLGFSSTRRGRAEIYVVDVGGGTPRRLTAGAGNNTSPAWGPYPR